MRVTHTLQPPRDSGSYIAVLPAPTEGPQDSAAQSSGRPVHHSPMGISPEMDAEEAASREGGTTCDSRQSARGVNRLMYVRKVLRQGTEK